MRQGATYHLQGIGCVEKALPQRKSGDISLNAIMERRDHQQHAGLGGVM